MTTLLNTEKMASEVKAIMLELGLTVVDKGLPEVFEASAEDFSEHANLIAAYAPDQHQIYINMGQKERFEKDPNTLLEIVAHELVHSFQDPSCFININSDPTSMDYWNQDFEIEAMGVALIWLCTCTDIQYTVMNDDGVTLGDVYRKMMKENPAKDVLLYLTNVVYDAHIAQNNAA